MAPVARATRLLLLMSLFLPAYTYKLPNTGDSSRHITTESDEYSGSSSSPSKDTAASSPLPPPAPAPAPAPPEANSAERCDQLLLYSYSSSGTRDHNDDDEEKVLECFGCKHYVDRERRTHFECPGCEKIVDSQGYIVWEFGPKCREYENDLPRFGGRRVAATAAAALRTGTATTQKSLRAAAAAGEKKKKKKKEPGFNGCVEGEIREGKVRTVVCGSCLISFDEDGNETSRVGVWCEKYEFYEGMGGNEEL